MLARHHTSSALPFLVWKRSQSHWRSLTVRFVDLEVRRLLEVDSLVMMLVGMTSHGVNFCIIVIVPARVGDFLLERLELGLQVPTQEGAAGYASATAWRFMIARLSWFSAWMRCATSPDCAAWSALARAWVTLARNTCDSWAAYPLRSPRDSGHEVGALLELHVDLRPAVFDAIAQCDQTVVGGHSPQHYQDDDNERNNAEYHVKILASLLVYLSNFRMRATHFVVLSVFPCTRKSFMRIFAQHVARTKNPPLTEWVFRYITHRLRCEGSVRKRQSSNAEPSSEKPSGLLCR